MSTRHPMTALRMPQELIDRVTRTAADLGVSRSDLVRQAVAAHLEELAALADRDRVPAS